MKAVLLIIIILELLFLSGRAQTTTPVNYNPSHKFYIGLCTGPGKLLQKAPADLGTGFEGYFNKFRTGWKSGIGMGYFFNPFLGAELDYNYFHTSEHDPAVPFEVLVFGQSLMVDIDITGKIITHELNPKVVGRLPLFNNKLSLRAGVGPVGIYYKSDASAAYNVITSLNESVSYHGYMPGLNADLSIGYSILPSLSVILQCKYLHVFIPASGSTTDETTQLIFSNLEDNYKRLSRFDGSLKLEYTFKFRRLNTTKNN